MEQGYPHSLTQHLRLLSCCSGRAERAQWMPDVLQTWKYLLSGPLQKIFKLGAALRIRHSVTFLSLSLTPPRTACCSRTNERDQLSAFSCRQLPTLTLGEGFLPSPGPGRQVLTLPRSPLKGRSFRTWFVHMPRGPSYLPPKAAHLPLCLRSRKLEEFPLWRNRTWWHLCSTRM